MLASHTQPIILPSVFIHNVENENLSYVRGRCYVKNMRYETDTMFGLLYATMCPFTMYLTFLVFCVSVFVICSLVV